MTSIFRLPLAYAALTLALSLLSYPLLKTSPPDLTYGSSAPIQVEIENPEQQKEEKKKLVDFISQRYSRSPSMVERIVEETTIQARSKGIDPLLFLAVIGVESSFNPNAVSNRGAVGLAQVLPQAHPDKIKAAQKAGKSASDIQMNIRMGLDILAEYRRIHNGNMRLALLRYNGSLKDAKGRYAAKVMAAQATLEGVIDRQPLHAVSLVAAP